MPKLLHHRAKCIGCNICHEMWPVRWRMSRADGKCTLVGGTEKKDVTQVMIHADELEANLKVAAACPVKIIRVVR